MMLPAAYLVLGALLTALGVWVAWSAGEQVTEAMREDTRAALLVVGPIALGLACLGMAIRAFMGVEPPGSRAAERAMEAEDDGVG